MHVLFVMINGFNVFYCFLQVLLESTETLCFGIYSTSIFSHQHWLLFNGSHYNVEASKEDKGKQQNDELCQLV